MDSPTCAPVTVADSAAPAPPDHPHLRHPVTVASPSPVAVGIPIREDCWSEGSTWTLIEAWSDHLSRGPLKPQDWHSIAAAVSLRSLPKSESQCRNRIDTLKKKYKIESSKPSSSWPFLPRLQPLFSPPPNDAGSFRHQMQHLHLKKKRSAHTRSRRKLLRNPASLPSPPRKDGEGIRHLTRAIATLSEAYERVESRRMQQAVELEKQRMGLAKELELQRMEFFVKTLLELSRLKRGAA